MWDSAVTSRAKIAGGKNDGGLTLISLLQALTVSDLCVPLLPKPFAVNIFVHCCFCLPVY